MVWLVVGFGLLALIYSLSRGAPYLPTHRRQIETALDLLDLKSGQTLIEIGSGDGRVAHSAASRGIKVIGYEINPFLVILARLRSRKYRQLVHIYWQDIWKIKFPAANGIYIFGVSRMMPKLDEKFGAELGKGTLVASYAFEIPGKKAINSKQGVSLYKY